MWWGNEAEIKTMIDKHREAGSTINEVDIDEIRRKYEKVG